MKRVSIISVLLLAASLFFISAQKPMCHLEGFVQNGIGEQRMIIDSVFPDVRIIINAPSPDSFDRNRKTALVLYALPNGNTIEWTAGKLMEEGDDWHYDIQNIGAQIRFVREICPTYNWVVVYLQSYEKSSWPTWSRSHGDDGKIIIQEIVDNVRSIFASYNPVIMLNGHSGGGRFIFDYITGAEEIPDDVARIAFLDSSYGYEDSLHSNKLANWLQSSDNHFLDVIAYNDSTVIYDGKPLVSPMGGTWWRSKKMQKDLSSNYTFTTSVDTTFIRHNALDGKVQFWLKQNEDGCNIYHTLLVERNGFIHSLLSGTECEEKDYTFWEERAYDKYTHKIGY